MQRAQAIRVANGYATDMGLRVLYGVSPQTLSPADLEIGPVLIIGPSPDDQETAVQRVGRKLRNDLRVAATALQVMGDENPLDMADALLADLKAALLSADDAPLRAGDVLLSEAPEYAASRYDLPAPGEQLVTVEMILSCRYAETYGRPDTTT